MFGFNYNWVLNKFEVEDYMVDKFDRILGGLVENGLVYVYCYFVVYYFFK